MFLTLVRNNFWDIFLIVGTISGLISFCVVLSKEMISYFDHEDFEEFLTHGFLKAMLIGFLGLLWPIGALILLLYKISVIRAYRMDME